MKRYNVAIKTIVVIIFIGLICLLNSTVYADTVKFTGNNWEDLNNNIQVALNKLGCDKSIQEACDNGERTDSVTMEISKTTIKYEVKWEKDNKEYTANIEAQSIKSRSGASFSAEVTVIEKEKSNSETPTEPSEIEPGSIGPYTRVIDVQSEIERELKAKGCPSQNISDGYNNRTSTTVDRGVKISYQVTWQKDKKEYIAYVGIWGGGTTYYGSISIKEGEDITGSIEPEGQHGVLGNSNANANHTVDEIMNEAEKFLNIGKNNGSKIDSNNLKNASDTLYNVLLGLGIALAIGIGMYLGVKFMLSSAEDKAKVKESLIPYIAGCIVIFGAFTIWKLAITLFGQVEQIASTHTSDSSYIALQNEQIKS